MPNQIEHVAGSAAPRSTLQDRLTARFGAPPPRPSLAVAIGILCAALSVALRFAATPFIGDGEALLTAFPLVLLASLVTGAVGGWVCLVLCTVASWYLFIGDAFTFEFGPNEPGILVGTFLAGAFVIGISVLLRRSFRQITELRGAETILSRELEHRIKNTLTLVLSIARQTFHGERTMHAAFTDFEGRMIAMAAAQDLLGAGERQPAQVARIVAHSLAPFCGIAAVDRLKLDGPEASIKYDVAVGLALVLHELATNAAKYGALSVEAGEIVVAWTVSEPSRRLALTWTERGGPPVTPPRRRGFGSTLVERIVTRGLKGSLAIDYPAPGLEATLHLPL